MIIYVFHRVSILFFLVYTGNSFSSDNCFPVRKSLLTLSVQKFLKKQSEDSVNSSNDSSLSSISPSLKTSTFGSNVNDHKFCFWFNNKSNNPL